MFAPAWIQHNLFQEYLLSRLWTGLYRTEHLVSSWKVRQQARTDLTLGFRLVLLTSSLQCDSPVNLVQSMLNAIDLCALRSFRRSAY